MFKALKLINFQAHARLTVEFDPGITTIKGPTDVGKSAVLRALRWVCLNDRTGDDFIRHGTERVLAKLILPDGTWIGRGKGEVGNIYGLNGHDFKAFGQGVPDEIAGTLQVSAINFQKQHDSHFWLAESAPEVSRQLNAVIDLSVIDTAMGNAAKMVRTARERVTVSEERIGEKRRRFKELKNETNRIEQFKLIKEGFEKYETIAKDHDCLAGVLRDYDSHNIPHLDAREAAFKVALQAASQIRILQRDHATLDQLVEQIAEAESHIRQLPDFSPVESGCLALHKLNSEGQRLLELALELSQAEVRAEQLEVQAVELKSKLSKHACPTCGTRKK